MKKLFLLMTMSLLLLVSACKLTQDGKMMAEPSELTTLEEESQPKAAWSAVGSSFGYSAAGSLSMAVYNGIPYVAYSDYSSSLKLTVKSYSGGAWIGGSVSTNEAYNVSMAIYDAAGTANPYVVYRELSNASGPTFKPVVKMYDGLTWSNVGNISLLLGTNVPFDWSPQIAVYDNNGVAVPFVVAKDRVMYYNGGSWVYLGSAIPGPTVVSPKIGVYDDNGTPVPYIAYHDTSAPNPDQITVVKYDYTTSAWVFVGGRGFTYNGSAIDTVGNTAFYLTAAGTPYVFFYYNNSGVANVKMFNGSSWTNVGTIGVGTVYHTSITVDEVTNNVYVSYQDPLSSGGLKVMKYNNATSTWSNLNAYTSTTTTGWVNFTNACFSNSALYIGYEDNDTAEADYVIKYQ